MSSKVTYEQVKTYHADIHRDLEDILRNIEGKIIPERDNTEQRPPVYLTKWRVKSVDSAYRKTKRYSDETQKKYISSPNDITDYAGLRILCLFEQDLIKTNEYLVDVFFPKEITGLRTVKLFNWRKGSEDKLERSLKRLKTKFQNADIQPNIDTRDKERGYKSIHYVVDITHHKVCHPVEIQLRTLLQDVWGELEHALVYKRGNINPHIKKSFYLLSCDLETSDMLVTHLRNVRDKEKCVEDFAKRQIGPYKVLKYENSLLPDIFKPGHKLHIDFENFNNHAGSEHPQGSREEWIDKFMSLYEKIIHTDGLGSAWDKKVQYWMTAELAFLEFVKGNLEAATNKYEDILHMVKKWNTEEGWKIQYYVPHFRLGEIKFLKGDIEKALIDFDISEEILSSYPELERNLVNEYRIKVKLANCYWQLGKEYLWLALNEIEYAKALYDKNISLFEQEQDYKLLKNNLLNNLCWYHLEQYINKKDDGDYSVAEECYKLAEEYYNQLLVIIQSTDSHNAFDTAMWFCYQSYLRDKNNSDWLKKAKKYCLESEGKVMRATNRILSENIYRNHVQEIMSTNDNE